MNKLRFNYRKFALIKVMPLWKHDFESKSELEKRNYAEETYEYLLNGNVEHDKTYTDRRVPYIISVWHDNSYCYLVNCTKEENGFEIITIYQNELKKGSLVDLLTCAKFLAENARNFIKGEIAAQKNIQKVQEVLDRKELN